MKFLLFSCITVLMANLSTSVPFNKNEEIHANEDQTYDESQNEVLSRKIRANSRFLNTNFSSVPLMQDIMHNFIQPGLDLLNNSLASLNASGLYNHSVVVQEWVGFVAPNGSVISVLNSTSLNQTDIAKPLINQSSIGAIFNQTHNEMVELWSSMTNNSFVNAITQHFNQLFNSSFLNDLNTNLTAASGGNIDFNISGPINSSSWLGWAVVNNSVILDQGMVQQPQVPARA